MIMNVRHSSTQTKPRAQVSPLVSFWRNEQGATAIEYALLASLIAVAIIGAVTVLGSSVNSLFTKTSDAVK